MNVRKKRRPRGSLEHGERVRVAGHACGDTDEGRSFDLHGDTLTVVGANPNYTNAQTGERMVSAETEDGGIVTVPRRALLRD